jgi:hypothetical protein
VYLQQRPLFVCEFPGIEECNQSNELVMKLRVHRLSSLAVQFANHSLTLATLFGKEMSAQPFQRPVIVVPDISDRLPVSLRDLAKTIPFEEVKLQGLLLVRSELLSQTIPNRSPIECFWGRLCCRTRHPLFVELFRAVVLPKIQIAPPVDRTMVRHLNDPGNPGTLLDVEILRPIRKIEKNFLTEVVRFRFVSKDSPGDMEHGTGMPAE